MPSEYAVIGCGSAKVWRRGSSAEEIRAADAYIGSVFVVSRKFVEKAYHGRWLILSAHYGLITPEQRISDYDTRIQATPDPQFIELVRIQGSTLLANASKVVSFAGADYSRVLRAACRDGLVIAEPLSGMGMHKRVKWLTEARVARRPETV